MQIIVYVELKLTINILKWDLKIVTIGLSPGGEGGGYFINFQYPGLAREKILDPIGFKVLRK